MPGAPERRRTALGRATAPRPLHTAALNDLGETMGAETQLDEGAASKGAAPTPRQGGES